MISVIDLNNTDLTEPPSIKRSISNSDVENSGFQKLYDKLIGGKAVEDIIENYNVNLSINSCGSIEDILGKHNLYGTNWF